MPKFVIRNTEGKFLKGGTSHYSNLSWVDSLEKARVFGRKCDASNCISARQTNPRWYSQVDNTVNRDNVTICEVQLTLVEESTMK